MRPPADLGQLGDFRLLREIGRGGMGVVYEAEQISLRRRVALKVLPFAAAMDPRQLQRFKNEALAAAHLHHENIVPVHAVGCERGVHYYAMQFIEGRSLAALIAAAARATARPNGPRTIRLPRLSPRQRNDLSRRRARHASAPRAAGADHDWVARLGRQAARRWTTPTGRRRPPRHQAGQPAAGSARTALGHRLRPGPRSGDAGLTMTGDMLGTLRYISPEQAWPGAAWSTTAATSIRWAPRSTNC